MIHFKKDAWLPLWLQPPLSLWAPAANATSCPFLCISGRGGAGTARYTPEATSSYFRWCRDNQLGTLAHRKAPLFFVPPSEDISLVPACAAPC